VLYPVELRAHCRRRSRAKLAASACDGKTSDDAWRKRLVAAYGIA
jgi:hypothetical protein